MNLSQCSQIWKYITITWRVCWTMACWASSQSFWFSSSVVGLENLHFFFSFLKILFIPETQRKRSRHRQREKQAPCGEPYVGLHPKTPITSKPKADAQPLSSQAPKNLNFKKKSPGESAAGGPWTICSIRITWDERWHISLVEGGRNISGHIMTLVIRKLHSECNSPECWHQTWGAWL